MCTRLLGEHVGQLVHHREPQFVGVGCTGDHVDAEQEERRLGVEGGDERERVAARAPLVAGEQADVVDQFVGVIAVSDCPGIEEPRILDSPGLGVAGRLQYGHRRRNASP